MTKKYDIDGQLIDIGDVVIIPRNSKLRKCVVLGFTNSGRIKLSAYRQSSSYCREGWLTSEPDIQLHNGMFYVDLRWSDIYVCCKGTVIPEQLRKFIK